MHTPLLLFGTLGWPEIVVILAVVLLLFGAKKLPEVMGAFGKGVKEFKKGMKDIGREISPEEEDGEKPVPPAEKERPAPPQAPHDSGREL
jgi:sec-independent protein translocase protein TatA